MGTCTYPYIIINMLVNVLQKASYTSQLRSQNWFPNEKSVEQFIKIQLITSQLWKPKIIHGQDRRRAYEVGQKGGEMMGEGRKHWSSWM